MSVRQEGDDDGVLVPRDRSSRVEDEDEDGGGNDDDDQNQALGRRERSKNSRAKHLLFLPLKKFRTLYSNSNSSVKKREKKTSPPTLSLLSHLEELDGGDGGGGGGGKGCHLCFMDVPNNKSPPSYQHLLRLVIEKNDFYSPECNPHRSPERRKP